MFVIRSNLGNTWYMIALPRRENTPLRRYVAPRTIELQSSRALLLRPCDTGSAGLRAIRWEVHYATWPLRRLGGFHGQMRRQRRAFTAT
jgi:hypothetical protein